MHVILPRWIDEDGQLELGLESHRGTFALELWTWTTERSSIEQDSMEEIHSIDPQGYAGALYAMTGKVHWFSSDCWFFDVGSFRFAGSDILGPMGDSAIEIQRSDMPIRMKLNATVSVAPLGSWAYLDKVGLAREWNVRVRARS